MSRTWNVSVAVGNIRGNPVMRQRKVLEDSFRLCAMAQVVLAVEIKLARYNRAFRRAANKENQRVFFERRASQVAVPARWGTALKTAQHVLTKGAGWIPQPARDLNLVFHEETKTVYGVAHLTNGAWNRKRKPFKKARQRRWIRQEMRIQQIVEALHQEGWTVVIGGDMNTGPLRPRVNFHRNQETVMHAGLMWLVVIPAPGVQVIETRERKVDDIHTDHPFIRAKLTFHHA